MGVTTFINTNYNFFGDPVMPVIVRPRRRISPSRHRRASSPGEGVGGRFFFDFGAVRTIATRLHASSRDSMEMNRISEVEAPQHVKTRRSHVSFLAGRDHATLSGLLAAHVI